MDPQTVIQGLIARGMPAHIAQGFAGNFAVESGFDPAINEAVPLVPGSRGGFGLAQWTGPRRRELESWAQTQGRPLADVDTQLDFLMTELAGPENRAWQAIQGAQTPDEAARLVSERFLRPGIPHLDRRVNSALQFAGMEPQMLPPTVSSQSQQPQQQGGLFSGIRNFFGGGQPDPNAGSNTDPFANLSRSQRTMLGFAALRDAAASLEGRDSSFFNDALGGFEAARERERLRAQGEAANRNDAAFRLFQLELLASQPGYEGLRPLVEAQREILMGPTGSAVPMVPGVGGVAPVTGGVGGGAMVPAGAGGVSQEQFLQGQSLQPGQSVDASGRPMGPYTGEAEIIPAAGPAPTGPGQAAAPAPAAPADPVAALDAQIADTQRQIDEIINNTPTGAQVALGAMAGVPIGDDPRAQARLARLQAEETRLLADRERVAADQLTASREEEQRAATQSRMEPLINDALGFLLDENGDIRSITSQIANVSGFGAGLLPGVDAADARLARAAVTELGAIAAMGSVREAREAGFGGSLSDADILLIQRSGGTFDLSQPEATARTLQRLQAEMGGTSGGQSGLTAEDQALIDRYR